MTPPSPLCLYTPVSPQLSGQATSRRTGTALPGPQSRLARLGLGRAERFPPGWAMGCGTIYKSICNIALTQCLPGASQARRQLRGTKAQTRLGPLGVCFPSYTLLLAPSPFLGTPARFAHMLCNNQTLGLQGRGPGGLSACEPSQGNVM